MTCADCRELLSGYLDDELMSVESEDVRAHIAECAECAREHEELARTSHLLRRGLVRHTAPDVLKARIRSALANPSPFESPAPPKQRGWTQLLAAGVVVAFASSALTFA